MTRTAVDDVWVERAARLGVEPLHLVVYLAVDGFRTYDFYRDRQQAQWVASMLPGGRVEEVPR